MDEQASAYSSHCRLFRHYSTLVTLTRASALTVLLLVLTYLVQAGDHEPHEAAGGLWGDLSREAVVLYLAACLVPLLLRIESDYLKRMLQIVVAGGNLERASGRLGFFSSFDTPLEWVSPVICSAGVFILDFCFLTRVLTPGASLLDWGTYLLAALLPVGLLAYFSFVYWSMPASVLSRRGPLARIEGSPKVSHFKARHSATD